MVPYLSTAFREQRHRDLLTRAEIDRLAHAAQRSRPRRARPATGPLRLIRHALRRTASIKGVSTLTRSADLRPRAVHDLVIGSEKNRR
jgi:hypothetical protein